MSKAIVKNDHLTFDKKNYFRAGAEDVNVGVYGEKKLEPWASKVFKHHFEKSDHVLPQGRLKLDNLPAHQVATIDIDEQASGKASLSGAGNVSVANVPVKVTASANASKDHSETDSVKLIKMMLDLGEIAALLNGDKDALTVMLQTGHHARVVHEVFVVVSASLADKIDTTAHVSLSGGTTTGTPVTVSASIKGDDERHVQTKLTLDKGQIFAYSTLKFKDDVLVHYFTKPRLPGGHWEPIAGAIEKGLPKLTAASFDEDGYGKGQ